MKQIQKGFTLIELMIVVAIIGILAAVAIPAYQDYVVKAKLSKVQSTIDPVKLALAMYFQENGSFPAGTAASAASNTFWTSVGLTNGITLPTEVSGITADGTSLNSVKLTLTLTGIKASGIDGKNVDIIGSGASGANAIQWTVGNGSGACASASAVTDSIAVKYFNCK